MARGGVNSLFKNSTNSLEHEVSKYKAKLFALALNGCLQATYPIILVDIITRHTRAMSLITLESYLKFLYK